jgi:hypothetical protein
VGDFAIFPFDCPKAFVPIARKMMKTSFFIPHLDVEWIQEA